MRAGPVPIGTGPDLRHDAVPMHTWASDRSVSAEVAERIREIAQRQLDRLDEVTAAAQAAVVRVAPLLAEDPALYAESLASTRANTVRFLMLMVSDPLEPIPCLTVTSSWRCCASHRCSFPPTSTGCSPPCWPGPRRSAKSCSAAGWAG